MPHIVVKWMSGRSEEQKMELAKALLAKAVEITGRGAEHFSVSVEDYDPIEWDEKVYEPEIAGKQETLCIKPGYGSLAGEKK